MTSAKMASYLVSDSGLPECYLAWPLYEAGVQHLGKQGKPISVKMPALGEDELLMRIDAVSLCYTDLKEIDQGQSHPRLTYRDLKNNPIVPGHEVSMTVVKVGSRLADQYKIGDRFTMQPDVWVNGVSIPFCFGMDGGYRQYAVIGKEILAGDAGNYLIPVPKDMSYAASAITEPWACVEAAYRMVYRQSLKEKGTALFLGSVKTRPGYQIHNLFNLGSLPGEVYAASLPRDLKGALAEFCTTHSIAFHQVNEKELFDLDLAVDDLFLLDVEAPQINATDRFVGHDTVIGLFSDHSIRGEIEIDLGKLHYDNISIAGSDGLDIADTYQRTPIRVDLKPNGVTWILGAGGPMGRMHLQRAIESSSGPRFIIASEITTDRLAALQEFYIPLAKKHQKELWIVDPVTQEAEFTRKMEAIRSEGGVDDVEIMVANPSTVGQAAAHIGCQGIINIFAGLKRGVKACVDPWLFAGPTQVHFVGHSGSELGDQKAVMKRAIALQLRPELSVAAIGGLNQIQDGIKAMKEWTYPGKIIIYPQVIDFPLTGLKELQNTLPQVYTALGEGETWSFDAEQAFLDEEL